MRAKRNQEVKVLETTVHKLQDKNKQLELQNKEYAKTLQQIQDEMRNLKTQLQGSMSAPQQQQSSSEVHQVWRVPQRVVWLTRPCGCRQGLCLCMLATCM
jgi:predicted RNase H-like nuclease (RuvC/YqgF family)